MMMSRWMNRVMYLSALTLLPLTFAACSDDSGTEEGETAYDEAALERARAAIPSADTLVASSPAQTGATASGLREQALVGELALYPQQAYPIVIGVNSAVGSMVTLLKTVVSVPPTFYDSAKKEFVWGPWPYDESVGNIAVYIKENEPGDDFRYVYAFVRLMDADLSTGSVIVWGGSNPDADNADHGSGLTLWDFEANRAFEQAHNPDVASLDLDEGRFLALYGKGMDEDGLEITQVLATFRGFIPKDNPDAQAANVDYYYGHVVSDAHTVDFLNYTAEVDIDDGDGDPATFTASALESIDVRMVFLDSGEGRAEVAVLGGDFTENPDVEGVSAVECWDAQVKETFLGMTAYDASGEALATHMLGAPEDCGPLFSKTIEELNIPTLDDVDPVLKAELDTIAEQGIQ